MGSCQKNEYHKSLLENFTDSKTRLMVNLSCVCGIKVYRSFGSNQNQASKIYMSFWEILSIYAKVVYSFFSLFSIGAEHGEKVVGPS